MNPFHYKIARYPLGIWITYLALILCMLAWIMQAYSLLNWEKAVNLGLQDSSFLGDRVEQSQAMEDRGLAIADLLWVLPLNLYALIGLARKRPAGLVASMMTFAICIYFPLFHLFQLWDLNLETALAAIFLWVIPSLVAIPALWAHRNNYFKNLQL